MKNHLTFLLGLFVTFNYAQIEAEAISLKTIESATEIAQQFLSDEQIPGMSISVSQRGDLIWSEGFGFSDIEAQKTVSPVYTQFRIASISKTLTAAALVKLIDDGVLDLDESIYSYVPEFPKKTHDFSVRQVGGHLAGIRHYNANEFILNKKMTIVEGLDVFKNSGLKFEPGTQYSYSTYGWNLLSVVIQNASKTDFNSYMTEEIFNPLGMTLTGLDLSDAVMPNRTMFYRKTNSGSIVLSPEVSNEFKVAGGGFVSTSEDLVKFGNEIISPKLLTKESWNEVLKSQRLTNGESTNYGVGIGVGKSINETLKYSHSGGGIGATSLLLIYPEEEIVIAILTNRSQLPIRDLGTQLERIFLD